MQTTREKGRYNHNVVFLMCLLNKGEIKQKNKSYSFEEVYQMWWSNDYTVYRNHEEITLDRKSDLFRL